MKLFIRLSKIHIQWRIILKVFIGVFIAVLVSLFLVNLYFLGFRTGFEMGVEKMQREVKFSEAVNTPSPTPSFTPSPKPQQVHIKPPAPTWGGPDLWEAVNKRRKELGVNPLSTRSELCTIAAIRLSDLLEAGKLDGHEGFSSMPERRPDLKWIFEKYNLSEFLLSGAQSAQEAVSLWENTLGHKKLLSGGEYVWGCIYAQAGFAVAIAAY